MTLTTLLVTVHNKQLTLLKDKTGNYRSYNDAAVKPNEDYYYYYELRGRSQITTQIRLLLTIMQIYKIYLLTYYYYTSLMAPFPGQAG